MIAYAYGTTDLGRYPLHTHVPCACGDPTCEAHLQVTLLEDRSRWEFAVVDGQVHQGVIMGPDAYAWLTGELATLGKDASGP